LPDGAFAGEELFMCAAGFYYIYYIFMSMWEI
jgi:hypothetical protein